MLITSRSQGSPTLGSEARKQCLRNIHLRSDKHDDNRKQSADHQVTLCLIKARSVCNKSDELGDHIRSKSIDTMVITETWLRSDGRDGGLVASFTLSGHAIYHLPRAKGRGGGLAIVYRQNLTVELMPHVTDSSFECMDIRVADDSKSMRLLLLYRSPPFTKNKFSASLFFVKFADVLERVSSDAGNLLLTSDFNFHWECADGAKASQFSNMLDSAGLSQHIRQ